MQISFLSQDEKLLITNNDFDSRAFFEAPFVSFAKKFKLIYLPTCFYLTDLEAINKRLNFVVPQETKIKVLNHEKLKYSDKKFLSLIASNESFELEINSFLTLIQGKRYGNIEEIESFVKDQIKITKKIAFIRIEK